MFPNPPSIDPGDTTGALNLAQIRHLLRVCPGADPEAAATLFDLPLDEAARIIDCLRHEGLLPNAPTLHFSAWSIRSDEASGTTPRTLVVRRLIPAIEAAASFNRAAGLVVIRYLRLCGAITDPALPLLDEAVIEAELGLRELDPAMLRRRVRLIYPKASPDQLQDALNRILRQAIVAIDDLAPLPTVSAHSLFASTPKPFRVAYAATDGVNPEVYGVDWSSAGLIGPNNIRHPWSRRAE